MHITSTNFHSNPNNTYTHSYIHSHHTLIQALGLVHPSVFKSVFYSSLRERWECVKIDDMHADLLDMMLVCKSLVGEQLDLLEADNVKQMLEPLKK